ncbi:FAD-binding domain-containing protein [Auricularia subglabra TFB-10046 SS5]|nr:FAD-binding domain-containing protein [Auricularia subglabra TFB-10046 SS5]
MAAQIESVTVDHLDADYLTRDLVTRARSDPSLQPLLPLLGAGSFASFPPKPPAAREAAQPIPTRTFAFDGEEGAGLEAWEVEEILAPDGDGPQEFKNWVACVRFKPSHVLLARSLEGVRRVARWAARTGRKLRVSGYRHTWSDLWTEDGEVILTFVHPDGRETLPYADAPAGWHSELHGVSLEPAFGVGYARVMAGTSNNEFREWCFNNGKPEWSLPFNVVVAEVTFGGSTSTICHGAGMGTPTLCDLVAEVRYVDARGKDQVVSDPDELRAASGAFGFLGIVTSVVLRLKTATVAEMRPTQVPLVLCIPPPDGFPLPEIVQRQVEEAGITQEDIKRARREFVRRAEEDHFHEFFWYPYQKNAWLNTWKRRPLTVHDADLGRYPEFGVPEEELASMSAYAALSAEVAKNTTLPGPQQTYAFGQASLAGLPNVQPGGAPLTTLTSEALHFRGGSQIFPFYGMEWEIPMPASPSGEKRDYTVIQRAWWDAITLLYSSPNAPVRAALEMRLTAGSDTLLAAQRGNGVLGTASLEVFTLLTTPVEEWRAFRQAVVDRWTSYGPGGDSGTSLARPHWNKQWSDLQVRGRDIKEYLREEAYKDAFSQFRDALEGILRRRGSSTQEVRERFGNKLMETLIWND